MSSREMRICVNRSLTRLTASAALANRGLSKIASWTPPINRKRVDLQKEILFEYSDPEVATYLKGRSYVSCEAGLVGFVGDVRVLSIRITVASRMARADYGYLSNNTLMSIKLINGETVTLFASGSDLGLIDNENNQTVYRASFQISRESQKILTSSPIDKIKIVWSTGYEEYPVTNVDFFMNQIRCLASK